MFGASVGSRYGPRFARLRYEASVVAQLNVGQGEGSAAQPQQYTTPNINCIICGNLLAPRIVYTARFTLPFLTLEIKLDLLVRD